MLHEELTSKIINSFYKVYNTLGFGFLEKVYENALAIALRKADFNVKQQSPIKVHFEGIIVGECKSVTIIANPCANASKDRRFKDDGTFQYHAN